MRASQDSDHSGEENDNDEESNRESTTSADEEAPASDNVSITGHKRTHDMRTFRVLQAVTHRMVKFRDTPHKIIIDSGASASGTGIESQLSNVRPHNCTIEAAFGPSVQPTKIGELPPFMLKTIVVEEMKDTTLLSVSQICRQDMVGIFTATDCRFYSLDTVLPYLAEISRHGELTLRGSVENGLYVQESS
jgi:hypothetical protein